MFDMTRHHLRQFRFRWLAWRADPLYLLFERMYQLDPQPLDTVSPHPGQRGFLLTHFSCADFARYRGREIAFFNERQVAVYWLPGAAHSGGGYVPSGQYSVTVAGHALRRPLQLLVHKDDEQTRIHAVTLQSRGLKSVQGGFISFAIITRELHCLMLLWLERMQWRLDDIDDCGPLRDLLDCARQLPGQTQMKASADALMTALVHRTGGRQ